MPLIVNPFLNFSFSVILTDDLTGITLQINLSLINRRQVRSLREFSGYVDFHNKYFFNLDYLTICVLTLTETLGAI